MSRGTVLVVDDEHKIRTLLELYLLQNEYDVLMADCGRVALELIKSERPDLIVLDVLLPDMNGLELCQQLRLDNQIPVIYLSCLQEPETIITGLDSGGDDYLTKPFDPNVLIAKINALLRRTRQIDIEKKTVSEETGMEELTSQERQILRWIEKGYTNKEIANKLKLTEGTIKVYNHVLFQKLQVKNRTQAIVRAKEGNII